MLTKFQVKPLPELDDLKAAFGEAASADTRFVHMTAVLETSEAGQAGLKKLREFIESHQESLLKAFNDAGVVCFSGMPKAFLNKVYPEISFWVRAQDAEQAKKVISAQTWCKSFNRKGASYRIGDNIHR